MKKHKWLKLILLGLILGFGRTEAKDADDGDADATSAQTDKSAKKSSGNADVAEDTLYFEQRLVNFPTGVNVKKRDLVFGLQHRFVADMTNREQNKASDFFGLDAGAQFTVDFAYGISDWLMAGVNRSSVNKNVEGYAQAALIKEFAEGESGLTRKNPFSLSVRAGAAIGLREGIDDMWSGNFQAIAARDLFGGRLHVYVVPAFTTRAHYSEDQRQAVGHVGFGAYVTPFGVKSMLRLVGEYGVAYRAYNEYANPWGGGFHLVTGDHTFAIIASNAMGTSLDLYAQGKNEFHLGFNLTRVFGM